MKKIGFKKKKRIKFDIENDVFAFLFVVFMAIGSICALIILICSAWKQGGWILPTLCWGVGIMFGILSAVESYDSND